ncbi:hypothetical protein O9G_002572 [Rozella allomycis CSF55]|uniref:Uncharacterized protein n=1 Tax=Rozella allomycis (strain CSF55) TaxID=988480 RepID=A0A075AU27_ROZAC|nr:hypothetical protein O9G_002572 [Rozella allomycis CSF55]|eukprot:EPZ32220.1 hypothetical protein O9G_002572 [Rozella allomycis CSF55]
MYIILHYAGRMGDQLTASTGCADNEYNEYCVPLLCQAYSWGHLAVIDTELERQIGIGRGYTLPPVPERGHIFLEIWRVH